MPKDQFNLLIGYISFCTIVLVVVIALVGLDIESKIDSIRPECKSAISAARYVGGQVQQPKTIWYPRGCKHK